jgi:hypothetical protein
MPRLLVSLSALLAIAIAMAVPAHAHAAAPDPTKMPTPSQLDAFLASKGSPMAGQGVAFVASGGRWQLDPRLLVAIAGAESSFGQITCAPYNAWGWGCPNGPYHFDSWAEGIDAVAEGLRTNYLSEGRTSVALIHQKYAPVGAANDPTGLNDNWTINVSRFMVELGGDPNDVDLDGIAGTLPLGLLGGAPLEQFAFAEEAPADAGAEDGVLEVESGAPRPLVVKVRNTGSVPWSTQDVRLRRIDDEARVAGAPFGALADAKPVEPNQVGTFVVKLAAVGSSSGATTTVWRLEGPSGPIGSELRRDVRFAVPAFVAGDAQVAVTAANRGIAGGEPAWNVVVQLRNTGSETWQRDGDEGVLHGLVDSAGDPLGAEGWVNERVAARMLEREAAPGEQASFAFRVRSGASALAMRPFRTSGWAAGDVVIVELGTVAPADVAALRERVAAAAGADAA